MRLQDKGSRFAVVVNYTINDDAQPEKNSTLYKIYKQGNPVRLLTTDCNTENLSRFIENICDSN